MPVSIALPGEGGGFGEGGGQRETAAGGDSYGTSGSSPE